MFVCVCVCVCVFGVFVCVCVCVCVCVRMSRVTVFYSNYSETFECREGMLKWR